MTSNWNAFLLVAGGSLAVSVAVKATLVSGLGLLGTWAARKSRASVRHAMLAAVFFVLAGLPLVSAFGPQLRFAIGQQARPPIAGHAVPLPGPGLRVSNLAASSSTKLPAGEIAFAVWALGAALFLAPVATGLWQVRQLRQCGLPWMDGQSMVDALAADAGLKRRIEVLVHENLTGPMTCGVARPAILLPREAECWAWEDLQRALLHELEHVRRYDWATHSLARVVCAAYWFHPLVWAARGRLALQAECACDDAVVARSEATEYADQLVVLATKMARLSKAPALAMASRADLAVRIRAVLDAQQRRGPAARWQVALAYAAAAVMAVAIAPVRVVAAPQPQTYRGTTALVVEEVAVVDAAGKPVENLAVTDFQLTEDDVPQTIRLFEFQKLTPAPESGVSSYYVIGYYPQNTNQDGQFRRVRVTLANNAQARLNFRSGYYANKSWVSQGRGGTAPAEDGKPGIFGGTGSKEGAFGGAGQGVSGGTGSGVSGGIGSGIGQGVGSGVGQGARPGQETNGVTPPVPLYKPEPEYSEEARKAKFQGSVILQVEIDASGRVTNAHVVKSLGMGLDEKAIDSALQWRFRPGTKDGKAVTVQALIQINFRLL